MTDIFMGFIGFVQSSVSDLPAIEQEIPFIGKAINGIAMTYDFISSANFLVPIPDIFAILSAIFVLKSLKTIIFIVNWIIKRVFDVIP